MNVSRQMRRRIARQSTSTPLGTADTVTRDPDRLLLSVRHGDATLNWQASIKEMQAAFTTLNNTPLARELGPQRYKEELRNYIILGIERNEHLERSQGNHMATTAMWYMWLKRDVITSKINVGFDRIDRLTMVIEPGVNNWYQFKWEIRVKQELELPALERIDVWTPFRVNRGFSVS